MTLDQAIKDLTLIHDTPPSGASQDFKDALKLGIEALKRFKRIQEDYPFAHNWTLPGETKD